ncbi:MAG TPA: type III pantothenate kinase [Anaerolineae bacterium]|nr:type III pantothenate kinase [Anaerolineae bacterium]
MLLAVDVGNTNIVFGIHNGATWLHHWRIRTVRDKMPDEYAVLFRGFIGEAGMPMSRFEQVVLSSVVPPLTGTLCEMLAVQTGREPLVVSCDIDTGLTFRVDNPREVGADLIADAVAAHIRCSGACIVVDFGTATTFTAVSAQAEFLGVAIAPGLNLAASALAGGTAQLPQIALTPPPRAIGTNTVHSIQAGIVLGYVDLVSGMLDRFRAELGAKTEAIATGGLSRLIAPLTGRFQVIDPWLTLEGIRLIALRNRQV